MTGLPYMIRLVVPTLGLRKPKVPVRCMDVAGAGVEVVDPLPRSDRGERGKSAALIDTR
jgi:hypothetical protein